MHHLDTSVVVDFLRGDARAVGRISQLENKIGIPAPVLAELYFGAEASTRRAERVRELERLLEHVELVPFDHAASVAYGRLRNELRIAGRVIGEMDTLIASIAVANNAILCTRNKKHFERVKGLLFENWS